MRNTEEIFLALLRSVLTGSNEEIEFTDINYEALYALSSYHDLAHIVFFELRRRLDQWEGDIYRKFEQQYNTALYRFVKRDLAIKQVQAALENAGIPYVLLKGTYLMKLYPEAWMRTSSDIDVLVEQRNHEKAIKAFEKCGFVFFAESPHDISFYTEDKYHVELHHSLLEEGKLLETTEILNQVWQYTMPIEDRFERKLDDEMLYFYHLAHMAKHFRIGGCGIRFFIDLWLLNHKTQFNLEKREALIQKSGLSEFSKKSVQLSERWFALKKTKDDLSEFEEFVIHGGIYGSLDNSVAIRKIKSKNRIMYYMVRLFLPYNKIKYSYPVLKRLPVLLPFCWMLRWFKLLNPKTRKHAINEITTESRTDTESTARIERLMKQLKIS